MTSLFDVTGKCALVTGGAQGMGRMIAEGFVKAGARVLITSRKADICAQTAEDLGKFGDCIPFQADLSTVEGTIDLAHRVASRESRLDVLINNAGKTWGAPIESFPDSAWQDIMCLNVQTPFTLVRELLPLLKASASADDPARIINIGSLTGLVAEKIQAYSYAASKAAIHHLTKVLAADLAQYSITANVVAPGYFPTRMTAHIRRDEDQLQELGKRIPLTRLGTPEDIAGTCIFLASRAGAYLTGVELPVDGGISGCS